MAKTNKTPKAEDNAELRTISLLKILNTYSDENHELLQKTLWISSKRNAALRCIARPSARTSSSLRTAALIFTRTRRRRTAITLRAAYLRCRN